MLKVFQISLLISIIFITNCIKLNEEISEEIHIINIGEVQTIKIKYDKSNKVKFNKNDNINDDDLFVNIYAIDCNIKIELDNEEIKSDEDNIYSLKIKKEYINNDKSLEIKALMDVINGKYKYNYTIRTCPLVINSGYYNNPSLEMEKSDPTIFYFDENLNKYNLLYKIENFTDDSFVTFSFIFNGTSNFDITFNSEKKFYIINSKNLYLSNEFLSQNLSCIDNCDLNITIESKDSNESPIFMTFKSIERNSTSMLERNYINQGFITYNTSNQYFYMEVFKGEEGEILLHDKRRNGILCGNIIKKNESNLGQFDMPNCEDQNDLFYNRHTFALKFSFRQTKKCENGCYILVTYFVNKISDNYITSNITGNISSGFEFNLFARVWDDNELKPQIINLPFSEYVFGFFEKDSIHTHYYSIFIPNEADKLIIQIEGNYLDGFMGEGKKKLVTSVKTEAVIDLNITQSKMLIEYSNLSNFNNHYISFAFRPKDYFSDVFSFYYFRVFYVDKETDSEHFIFPLDSKFGNICVPKKKPDNNNELFHCYFLLKNDYNDFLLKNLISVSEQNTNVVIFYTKYYKNNTKETYYNETNFFDDIDDNEESILFEFIFDDDKISTILMNSFNSSNLISPSIYFSSLYDIDYINNLSISLLNRLLFSLVITRVYGSGVLNLKNMLDDDTLIYLSRNEKGKPIYIRLSDFKDIKISGTNNKILFVKIKLEYINLFNGASELNYGESMSEIIINKEFPICYYLKNIKQYMDINFRIINYLENNNEEFDIEGYILDYEYIERKIKGEDIKLINATKGKYDISSKSGLLQINNTKYEGKYILITIDRNEKNNNIKKQITLIQIISINEDTKRKSSILPINQYINGNLNSVDNKENEITYLLQISQIDSLGKEYDYLIEFNSNYNDIEIHFNDTNKTNLDYNFECSEETGIKKYRAKGWNNPIILKIINPNNRKNMTYLLRYFSTKKEDENTYFFSKNYKIYEEQNNQNNSINIIIEFDNLEIKSGSFGQKDAEYKIYANLFPRENITNEENLITYSYINSETKYKNRTIAKNIDKKFSISFFNIEKSKNHDYKLQIKFHVIFTKYLLDEELLVYTIDLNLKKYFKNKISSSVIAAIIIVIVIIIIFIIFIIIYYKLRKKNRELKEKVESISFSTGINEEELNKLGNRGESKTENDYETTFI